MNKFVVTKDNLDNKSVFSCINLNKSKCIKNQSCDYQTLENQDYNFDDKSISLKMGNICSMKIDKNLLEKFLIFIIEEILLNQNENIIFKVSKNSSKFINDDKLNTLFLSELEYESLLNKIIFPT